MQANGSGRSIYALRDPRTNSIMYIGATANITRRMYSHAQGEGNPSMGAWMKELRGAGLKPLIEILEEADASVWRERERHHVGTHQPPLNRRRRNVVVCGEKFLRWVERVGPYWIAEQLDITRQAVEAWMRNDSIPSHQRIDEIVTLSKGELQRDDILIVTRKNLS